ncbi:DUF1700 domain-containing protein [Amycolatopsis benzoatilytica]|uniref:DUF1700 domain-containing protein n=1 Tax=Amycolatopsis benzoatilytica TaxID=346045 RepID=UPI0003644B04|nr:hypothetical protein [Amycolatopsis benzoatilytica]
MSTDKSTAVRVYLARVRTALADLPAAEVEELLADVRPHLNEIEAELGANATVDDLAARLGTPESYAAELRASGGYPAAPETAVVPDAASAGTAVLVKPNLLGPRLALWGLLFTAFGVALVGFYAALRADAEGLAGMMILVPVFAVSVGFLLHHGIESVRSLPEVNRAKAIAKAMREDKSADRVVAYLSSLKPAWWVVCALVLVGFGLLLMVRQRHAILLLPFLAVVAGLVLWAGPRIKTDARLLWLAVPVSAFVVGGAFGGVGAGFGLVANHTYASGSHSSYDGPTYYDGELRYGTYRVNNVYAFDANGKPLQNVYLYDDRGRPLTITRYGCEKDTGTTKAIGDDNEFPRPQLIQGTQDDRGNVNGYNAYRDYCREEPGVPFAAAIPKPPASSSAPATPASPAPPTK